MAEVDWGTEDNQAKRKKRIPTWAWIGGGCCGVVLIGIIALVVGGGLAVRTLNDQPKNWSALAEHVQYDDSFKEGKQIVRLPFQIGHEGAWLIESGDDAALHVRVFDGDNAHAMRKRLFEDKDTSAYQQIGVLKAKQIESGTLEVQGRTVARVRFLGREASDVASDDEQATEESDEKGSVDLVGAFMPSVSLVDITPEGSNRLVLFHYAKRGAKGQVPDEEVIDALAPFHVGPDR